MDLGTVDSRIQRGMYSNIYEVLFDIEAIWNACITYNGSTHFLSVIASTYKLKCRNEVNTFINDYYKENPEELSIMQNQLRGAVTSLSSEDLSIFIYALQQEYPECFQMDNDGVKISFEGLDAYIVHELYRFCCPELV